MASIVGTQILLVEDDDADLELTLRSLTARKVANHIDVARDGVEALAMLRRETLPRVVLLDLKLPRMNGIEVLEAIRKDPRTYSLPVVILTSSSEEPDIARAYALGANSYIVKPVQFESFAAAVAEIGMYWMLQNKPPMIS